MSTTDNSNLIIRDMNYASRLRKNDVLPNSVKNIAKKNQSISKLQEVIVNNFMKKNVPPIRNPSDRKEIEN